MSRLHEGEVVGGRYVVDHEIAAGGMGRVYAVRNRETGADRALKVIKQSGRSGAATLERFRREAQLLSKFDHPGVVGMTDAGLLADGSAFLVMERLEGETLLEVLRREAPLSPARLSPIVDGMAAALDVVHAEGVIHRDLKPSNVFLTPDGVKLVDFGVAHGVDLVSLTITGQVVGTVRWMSPEQLEGKGALDHRSDVYAMGLLVWAALVGRPPHGGTIAQATMSVMSGTPRLETLAPGLGGELAAVVHRAIAVDRNRRFTSAGAFAAAFRRVAQGDDARQPRPATGFIPLPPTRVALLGDDDEGLAATGQAPVVRAAGPPPSAIRKAMPWLAIAALVVGGLSGAALFFTRPRPTTDAAQPGARDTPLAVAPVVVETAPPAVVVDEPRTVRIVSEPSGAMVELDGVALGNTPFSYPAVLDDEIVVLRVVQPDFEAVEVRLNRNTPDEVEVELLPRRDRPRGGRADTAMLGSNPAMSSPPTPDDLIWWGD